jgi:hypothetical protein
MRRLNMKRFRWWIAGLFAAAGGVALLQSARTDEPAKDRVKVESRIVGQVTTKDDGVRTRPGEAGEPPRAVISAGTMPHLKAVVDGRTVQITGAAEVFCREPQRTYIWLVRIYDDPAPIRKPEGGHLIYPKRKLLQEHHYLERPIRLPAGQERMAPIFADAVDLKPGRYQVVLTLYGVRPGFPFEILKRGEDLRRRADSCLFRQTSIVVD